MKELKQYYRQIGGWLPCGGRLKKQMMSNIRSTVEGYRDEHPEADFAAIQTHFGTPQQIAASFVDEMGTEELLYKLRVRNRIIKIVLLCVCAVVAIYGLSVLSLWLVGLLNELGYATICPPMTVS